MEQAAAELRTRGLPDVMVKCLVSLTWVFKQGWAAGISTDVERLTGPAPRRFADLVAQNATAWA